MRENKKLYDVFTDPLTSGIFSSLQSLDVPWKNEGIATELDLSFISNYGARKISPLVNICLDETGKLTAIKQALVASTIYNLYKVSWAKQYNTMLLEYNPIENYNMVETHTGTDTHTQTPTDWKQTETQTPTNWKQTETQTPTNWVETQTQTPTEWKQTETQTPTNWVETKTDTPTDWVETRTDTPTDWVETTTGLQADNEADANNSVYAFNSANAVKISESESKVSSKSEVERTGTFESTTERTGTFESATERTGTFKTETEHTGTFETETERTGTFETETEQTGTFKTESEQTGTFENETVYDTELQRSGNIGVTTSQQMLESERELWKWNFFQNVVFPDICKVMTLSIY